MKTSGDYRSLDQIRRTVLNLPGGGVVHVDDVAEVELIDAEPSYLGLYNGKRSVFVAVEQRAQTNIFTVFDGLKIALETYKQELPENISTEIVFDQSVSVEKQVNGFFINLSSCPPRLPSSTCSSSRTLLGPTISLR